MAISEVGDDIEALCGRCGQCWHVVMAKVGDQIAKVVCKRCGAHHSYRSDAPRAATESTSVPERSRPARRRTRPEPLPEPIPTFDKSKPPRPYAANGSYVLGDRIEHPSFGTGVVTGSPGPGKTAIAFPGGARVLVCAKVASTLERPIAATNVPIADRPPKAG